VESDNLLKLVVYLHKMLLMQRRDMETTIERAGRAPQEDMMAFWESHLDSSVVPHLTPSQAGPISLKGVLSLINLPVLTR
jgi:hypothetical protein